jgi:hypothetical protein
VSAAITGHPRAVPEMTEDGHFVVVDGRRWRATDPAIPDDDAAVLRRWLMAGRRAVGAATKAGDAEAESAARARVHAAKTALGERGPAWWEQTDGERRGRWTAGLRRAADEGFGPRDDETTETVGETT